MRKAFKIGIGAAAVVGAVGLAVATTDHGQYAINSVANLYGAMFPEAAAISGCKDDVLLSANDPSSIEWANRDQWVIERVPGAPDGDRFVIHMQVRGANGFGGKVIERSKCEVHVIGGYAAVMGMHRQH